MNTSTTVPRQISPLIVRAWFDTVLNPLLHGLDTEARLLTEGNLTWRFQPQGLVSLVPVRLLVESLDNMEQFLTVYPECAALIINHDQARDVLYEACRRLETTLVQSLAMSTMFQRAVAPIQITNGTDVQQVFGACEPDDYLRVLAEYIINDVQRLPSYFVTADFWNKHSQEFLSLRESADIRLFWRMTLEAKDNFTGAVTQLKNALRMIRNDLSFSAGVPIEERTSR